MSALRHRLHQLWAGVAVLLLFAVVAVVFVEPFRKDEAWYIYRARLGIDIGAGTDGLTVLLHGWFKWVKDLWFSLLLLRVMTLAGYALAVWVSYLIVRHSGMLSDRPLSWVVGTAFASWLAINRGFEVRPEMIAHLSMLFAVALTVGWLRLPTTSLMMTVGVLLFIPTLLSLRFWPVAFAMFFMLTGAIYHARSSPNHGFGRTVAVGLGFAIFVIAIHVVALDLLGTLESAAKWRYSNDRQFGALDTLFFAIHPPILYAFFALWACIIAYVGLTSITAVRSGNLPRVTLLLAPIVAYYGFFFIMEVKPYRYTRALEAVVFFSSIAVAVRINGVRLSLPRWLRAGILSLFFLGVSLVAYKDLGPRYRFVETFFSHYLHPNRMSTGLNEMHPAKSLVQQVMTRVRFCESHPSQKVLISKPYEHPFCGVDLGSIYNAGFRVFPDELRFKGIREVLDPVFVSNELSPDLQKLGFECTSEAGHYAFCRRRGSGLR